MIRFRRLRVEVGVGHFQATAGRKPGSTFDRAAVCLRIHHPVGYGWRLMTFVI